MQSLQVLQHWLADGDLAAIRDPDRLAALADDERQQLESFWRDYWKIRESLEAKR